MANHPPEARKKLLEVTIGGHSSAGRKPLNEDAFAALQPEPGERAAKGVVLCIADGASCSDNAQLASQTAVSTFIEDYYSTPETWSVRTAAARVLSALNAWLFQQGRQYVGHNSLVTTFSGAILKSTTAHLLHVGDSRIHRWRNGSLELLTRDHQQRNRDGSVYLTRALGIDCHLEVDYLQEELERGDVLMFTTDGVHAAIGAVALGELMAAPYPDLETRARAVVEAAFANGSDDNLSCLLVRIEQLPIENIDEAHRRLTELTIPPPLGVGQSIDGYRVLRVIHSGTRSHLYLVQGPDGTACVLKAPSPNFADDPHYLEGFIREQWIGRRIDHHAVMKIFARPARSPFLYLLCEYIEGQTLRQWMFDHPSPPLDTVRKLMREIIVALRVFQRQQMVHRDLKPENIMLPGAGGVKLIDFGTVQVSGLGEIHSPLGEDCPVGSADYIAPEYLLGGGGSVVSDIFSLGVIVYEMLTGTLPFALPDLTRRPPRNAQAWRYRSACEHRRDIPPWVDLALQKATAPLPGERYQAFSEFEQDLVVPNADLVSKRQSAPLLERNPVQFWRASSLLLLLIVLLQWWWMASH